MVWSCLLCIVLKKFNLVIMTSCVSKDVSSFSSNQFWEQFFLSITMNHLIQKLLFIIMMDRKITLASIKMIILDKIVEDYFILEFCVIIFIWCEIITASTNRSKVKLFFIMISIVLEARKPSATRRIVDWTIIRVIY